MKPFNYIYFRIGSFFKLLGVENNMNQRIASIIGLLQTFNIFALLDLVIVFKGKYHIILIMISLITIPFNLIRFNNESFEVFSQKWKDKPKTKKVINDILIIAYIIASFTLPFVF
jgi:hypothetical protein